MHPTEADPIALMWLAWLAYWMVAARAAKPTQRIESAASRASHMLPIMLAAWLLWSPTVPGGFLSGWIFPPGRAVYVAGTVLVVAGLGFAVWARRWLGRNWSGTVTLKQDHELIRGGPYRLVRHPIYSGLLVAFIGSALARDQWRGVLAVAIAWLALWHKLHIEERWMIERFGDAYRRFRSEVPALMPNPFRTRGDVSS